MATQKQLAALKKARAAKAKKTTKKTTPAKKTTTKRTGKLSGFYPKGTKTTYEVTTGRAGGTAKMKYTNIDEMFNDLKTAFRLGYAEKAKIEAIMVLPANA